MTPRIADAERKARALYARSVQGVLSTISVDAHGFPFGSVAPFVPDARGWPVLLVSRIAEHTRNMDADPRVSLILMEDADDAQEAARLTVLGHARRVAAHEEAGAADRYFRRFPHAAEYHRAHDFTFYAIEPARLRFIGGFAQIHWLEPAAVCRANPFRGKVEEGMATHMNQDHASALRDYCRLYGIEPAADPRLAGIDAEGFDLMVGKRLVRIEFDAPVASPDEVRKAMVAMVMKARELAPAKP